LRSIILALLFSTSCLGQLSIDYDKAKSIVGVSNPRIYANYVLIGSDSDPKVAESAIIKVNTTLKFVLVSAKKSLFESVPVQKMAEDNSEWLLVGSGRYLVEVIAFDPGIEKKEMEVIIGLLPPTPPNPPPNPPTPPTPPTPPSPPSPVVPPDAFHNLGQRVATTTNSLPKRAEVALLYRRAAERMASDPTSTINGIVGDLVNNRTNVLGADEKHYLPFIELINAEKAANWPMSRGTYADFLSAIAVGLEAK
jgi:hypothetical protein